MIFSMRSQGKDDFFEEEKSTKISMKINARNKD